MRHFKAVALITACLSLVQGVVWLIMCLLSIFSYSCMTQTTGSSPPYSYRNYLVAYLQGDKCTANTNLFDCAATTAPETLVAWHSVTFVVNIFLTITSVGIIAAIGTRTSDKKLLRWLYSFIVALCCVLVMDLCLTVVYAVDADQVTDCRSDTIDTAAATLTLITLAIIASKGVILWLTDLAFVVALVSMLAVSKGPGGYRRRYDDKLTTASSSSAETILPPEKTPPKKKQKAEIERASPGMDFNISGSVESLNRPIKIVDRDGRQVPEHSAVNRWPELFRLNNQDDTKAVLRPPHIAYSPSFVVQREERYRPAERSPPREGGRRYEPREAKRQAPYLRSRTVEEPVRAAERVAARPRSESPEPAQPRGGRPPLPPSSHWLRQAPDLSGPSPSGTLPILSLEEAIKTVGLRKVKHKRPLP